MGCFLTKNEDYYDAKVHGTIEIRNTIATSNM